MNAHGDTRDDEDAAERNHRDRMRAIYARVTNIDAQRQVLDEEKSTLLAEVCESIGISPGVVLENVRGEKAQVLSCSGDFEIGFDGKPGEPYTVYPSAACLVAPATKDGFHSRTRIRHCYLDGESAFKAHGGYPLLDCPECAAAMLYEGGEPWDGPSHGCPECGHTQPEKRASVADHPPAAPAIAYTPGTWFEAKSHDELQAFFLSRLPAIRDAARDLGYAIGLHGSLRRDLDLIATPWRDGAVDKEDLAHAISKAATGLTRAGAYQWEAKPAGRMATSISCCWTPWPEVAGSGHIDLSVVQAAAPALVPLTDEQVETIIAQKYYDPAYSKNQFDFVATLAWYKLGLRDGEQAHGINGLTVGDGRGGNGKAC